MDAIRWSRFDDTLDRRKAVVSMLSATQLVTSPTKTFYASINTNVFDRAIDCMSAGAAWPLTVLGRSCSFL